MEVQLLPQDVPDSSTYPAVYGRRAYPRRAGKRRSDEIRCCRRKL